MPQRVQPWLLLFVLLAPRLAAAQGETHLDEVQVRASQESERPDINRAESSTVLKREQFERFQPSNIFEAVEGVPGVSVNGGPRGSGMKFNIRGYSDNEDVLIKLDGAQKGFEKYRFGGTFIEPEFLKEIEVIRGPSLLQGSGALGGTVLTSTRDAADLLLPGERVGMRVKAGYATNNREKIGTAMLYGRPNDRIDLVAGWNRRYGDNYRLPDGSELEDSAVDATGVLLKGTVYPTDTAWASGSYVGFSDQGRQPYDATGGQPGVFGFVTRTIDDQTATLNAVVRPANPWIDLRATIGYSNTKLHDLIKPGESIFASTFTGEVNDDYSYDIWTLDVANRSTFLAGPVGNVLTLAVQGLRNQRDVTRTTQNPVAQRILYPGGFNPQTPPGTKESLGLIAQIASTWGPLTIQPGVRFDWYESIAEGGTKALMEAAGQQTRIKLNHVSPAVSVAFRVPETPWLLTYAYVRGFRPPLIDEYFTQGAFSRCLPFLLGPGAPTTAICGALYEPEESRSQEVAVSYAPLQRGPLLVDGRVAYFWNYTWQTLESITQTAPGVIEQPGSEERYGLEAEVTAAYRWFFTRAGYWWVRGSVYPGQSIVSQNIRQNETLPLYDVPGDTLSILVGGRFWESRVETGIRYRDVKSRTVVTGFLTGNRLVLGTQPGYTLWDGYVAVRPVPSVELRVAVENAFNETYFLNDGFGGGIGSQAPGRTFRLSIAASF